MRSIGREDDNAQSNNKEGSFVKLGDAVPHPPGIERFRAGMFGFTLKELERRIGVRRDKPA